MANDKPPLRDINPVGEDGNFTRLWQYFFTAVDDETTAATRHIADLDNPHGTSDANLVFSDVITNDVSINQHGFVPKAPNDTSEFLSGDGTWRGVADTSASDTVVSETAYSQLPDGGTADKLSRGDHTHGTPDREIPTAGTTGQLLAKKTNTNWDVEWISPSGMASKGSFAGIGVAAIVVTDAACTANSKIVFSPTSATSSATLPYVSAKGIGSFTVTATVGVLTAGETFDYHLAN